MKRVTGIGGIFFKSDNPEKLCKWYENHLGIRRNPDGTGATVQWREADDAEKKGMTVWSVFPQNTEYFNPSHSAFMINYCVDDLDTLLEALEEEGVQIDPRGKITIMAASPGLWIRRAIASSCGSRRRGSSRSLAA